MESMNFMNSSFTTSRDARPTGDITDKELIFEKLSKMLANSYLMYLTTQKYHWNVTGYMFSFLHQEFQKQYEDLALAIDVIAERIRALGFPAPGTFTEFSRLATFQEDEDVPAAMGMVERLLELNISMSQELREDVIVLENSHDHVTAHIMIERMNVHEKNAWILKSFLE